MDMIVELSAPGVQHGQDTGLGTQPLGIGGKGQQGFRSASEQQAKRLFGIGLDEGVENVGERENLRESKEPPAVRSAGPPPR